jgi:Asp-tRNA(Asn)/Glu-tRNA(Gln) amidotransferase A subunit family amidase
MLQVVAAYDPQDPATENAPVPNYANGLREPKAPRLGLVRDFFLEKASDETRKHVESVAERFARAGATIEEVKMPASFAGELDAHFAMMQAEAAVTHRERYAEHKARYSSQMQDLIEKGRTITAAQCIEIRRHQQRFRHEMNALCQTVDVLLTPSTPAPAPQGLGSTGDPTFNGPASFSGIPSLGLPSDVSNNGLPFAIQLMSGAFTEERLLAVGKWCEAVLDFRQVPLLQEES